MKKYFLFLFILIICLFSLTPKSTYSQAPDKCDYKEKKGKVVKENDQTCTDISARGVDKTGNDFKCEFLEHGQPRYKFARTVCVTDTSEAAVRINLPDQPAAPAPPVIQPQKIVAVLSETEIEIKRYCLNKLLSLSPDTQTPCFNRIMDCVKANGLTTCLTAYDTANPAGVTLSAAPEGEPATEEEIVSTPTEVWLQTADGEDRLNIQGGSIRFPVNKIDPDINEIRVKIVFDKPDQNGDTIQYKFFKVKRTASQQAAPPVAPETPVTAVDEYIESCWELDRNECVPGCGRSRTVERYTCEGVHLNEFRTKPGTEGQDDELCVANQPTTFLRYECTGCKEARRVDQYCNGKDFIAQEDIEGIEECADRCPPLPTAPCEKEDLAYYCEGDENAVYKYRDVDCQIQFTTVECRKSGQVCNLGDCVDE